LVLGPKAQQELFQQRAKELGSPLFLVSEQGRYCDEENRWIAFAALKILKNHFSLSDQKIQEGLLARPKCRFEIFKDLAFSKEIIFDVAHNPDGFGSLYKTWRYFYSEEKPRVICGMSKSKDIFGCMKFLSKMASHIHIVGSNHDRLAFPEEIANSLKMCNYEAFSIEKNIQTGVLNALRASQKREEKLLVCGSFFIMNDVRRELNILEERDELSTK
jgi:dihydrofolate synthase/folylpolyglutamate synthase